MGSALSTFTDFMNLTGPSFLTSARDIVNEAVNNTYVLSRFLRGQDESKILQGGSTIKDTIFFDEQSTYTPYDPNDTFTWQNPQVEDEWEIRWRFYVDHMSWTDQELELNVGSGLRRSARHQAYKDMKYAKEQRMWTSILNGMEASLWRVPETAEMEAATGKHAYSIPAFINEQSNGLFYGAAGGKNSPVTGKTAWTTVEGIDPTAIAGGKWGPQQQDYDSSTVNDDGNIISKFDDMWNNINFLPPPTRQQYFENDTMFRQFVCTSNRGFSIYKQLLRESQDTFVTANRQDPDYNSPTYSGIDVMRVATLDTQKLYAAATGTDPLVTEIEATAAESSGPRYYWINANYLCPVFHTSRYMSKHPVITPPNQPFTHIQTCDTWWNLVCRSRQRQGIVGPTATGQVYTS